MRQPYRDPFKWFHPEELHSENEKLREMLTDMVRTRVNPPIVLKERPVIGEGLIILPIKGSAL